MIVRGGMNVYADDVEAALQAHPAVVEAAVVGIPHDVLGEDVAAYVVVRPGETLSRDELERFVGERLADYKVPRHISFLAELPEERRWQGSEGQAHRRCRGRPAALTG